MTSTRPRTRPRSTTGIASGVAGYPVRLVADDRDVAIGVDTGNAG